MQQTQINEMSFKHLQDWTCTQICGVQGFNPVNSSNAILPFSPDVHPTGALSYSGEDIFLHNPNAAGVGRVRQVAGLRQPQSTARAAFSWWIGELWVEEVHTSFRCLPFVVLKKKSLESFLFSVSLKGTEFLVFGSL